MFQALNTINKAQESLPPWVLQAEEVCCFFFFLRFIFGCAGSSLLCVGFSLVVASRGYSSLGRTDCSLQWLLPSRGGQGPFSIGAHGVLTAVASCCGARALGVWASAAAACELGICCPGLVARQHVGSSQTRDQTHVPCTGRWALTHWATREVISL